MNTEEHLLTIVAEECNEVGQRASKALRFGLNEIQEGQTLTNAERLIYEFNDLVAVMEMLREAGYIHKVFDGEQTVLKKEKVRTYLNYSKSIGKLDRVDLTKFDVWMAKLEKVANAWNAQQYPIGGKWANDYWKREYFDKFVTPEQAWKIYTTPIK